MGPRSSDRGCDHGELIAVFVNGLLQWVHGPRTVVAMAELQAMLEAKSFNGSTVLGPWLRLDEAAVVVTFVKASMGPRSSDRGCGKSSKRPGPEDSASMG